MLSSLQVFDIADISSQEFVRSFDNIHAFKKAFRIKYEFIYAYHATVLNDQELKSVQTKGLRVSSIRMLKNKALSRFIATSDSKEFQNRIALEINKYFRKDLFGMGEINFGLVPSALQEESYHYLLFGPETLLPLASILKQKFLISFRTRMVEFGSHYMIKVAIPIQRTEDIWIEGIFEYLVNDFVETSLVYHYSLFPQNIIKIEEVKRPSDVQFMVND